MNTEHTENGSHGVTTPSLSSEIKVLLREDLPYLLKQITDPPEKMFYIGNTDILYRSDAKYLCIVGARKYSEYGEQVCDRLVEGLKGLPVIIVSGLALGVDGLAHRSALKYGLPTIAVPGSGIREDILYPRMHVPLAEDILAAGGIIMSEYPPDMRASPWSFPVRNRILAGLSHAVLIIEGEKESGTLITARLALDYNRDVGAVPGSIFSPTSEGPNSLLKRGAIPITCAADLLVALGFNEEQDEAVRFARRDALYKECSQEEIDIARLLAEPRTKDELVQLSGLTISHVQILVSMLEIRGLISEQYGKVKLMQSPP